MNRVSGPFAPPYRTSASRLTASKYSCNLAWSWPTSASPNSLNHSLQVYLQTGIITGSKFARWRPPSASLISLQHGPRVHLQTRSITAFKCISKLARLRPPSMHNHGRQVHLQPRSIIASKCISQLPQLRPWSASLNSLDHGVVKWYS